MKKNSLLNKVEYDDTSYEMKYVSGGGIGKSKFLFSNKCKLVIRCTDIMIQKGGKEIIAVSFNHIKQWTVYENKMIIFNIKNMTKIILKAANTDVIYDILHTLNNRIGDICVEKGIVDNFMDALELMNSNTKTIN